MNVGDAITTYLHDNGISKAHVATRAGISRSRMTDITKNHKVMSLPEYLAICNALKVKVTEFLNE